MRPLRLILASLALLVALPAAAQTFPAFSGLVVDNADVLSPAVEADLTRKLQALQHDTHRQLVVATIADVQGLPLEDYGYRLGRSWGVGLKGVDNGIILFLAPNNPQGQRGPRIEVGHGLEGMVPDALAGRIIEQQMMPHLRDRDVDGAVTAGTDALIRQLRASPEEAQARADAAVAEFDRTHAGQGDSRGGTGIGIAFWVLFLGIAAISLFSRGRRGVRFGGGSGVWLWGPIIGSMLNSGDHRGRDDDDHWGGGGSGGGWGGGGFTGGGGGSFGGGGASGGW